MNKLDRIHKAIAYLKGKQIISKQQDIVEKMKVNKSSVSLALKGDERYLTDSFLIKFSEAFTIDQDYLINGVGELEEDMYNKSFNEPPEKYKNDDKCKYLMELLEYKNDEIKSLKVELEKTKKQNNRFQNNH